MTTTQAAAKMDINRFRIDGMYVTYQRETTGQFEFVARFKYKPGAARNFVKFLAAHFTEAEYFDALASSTPLQVAESKGYLLPHIKTLLKREGYPVTREGFDKYIRDGIARRAAAQ